MTSSCTHFSRGQPLPLRSQVIQDSIRGAVQSDPTDQQDKEDHVREDRGHVRGLKQIRDVGYVTHVNVQRNITEVCMENARRTVSV